MTSDPRAGDREGRFTRLLAEYLTAAEAGAAPDPVALAARHPEFRAEFEEFFALRADLDRLTGTPPRDGAPRELGGYALAGELGRGGMGVVYRAGEPGTGRAVALKVILAGRFATPAERQRFRAEAEAAARLDHPGIVPVYHVGEADGHLFYTMKLLEGGDLRAHLPRLRADPRGAARVAAGLARAVHHAHQRGVLHRDLKPSNVLLDPEGR
ncbi:protein kinase, partial [bacterium]|nr:protein kinase [bacterium]